MIATESQSPVSNRLHQGERVSSCPAENVTYLAMPGWASERSWLLLGAGLSCIDWWCRAAGPGRVQLSGGAGAFA